MKKNLQVGQRVRITKGLARRGMTGVIIEVQKPGKVYAVQTDQVAIGRNYWPGVKGKHLEVLQ